MSFWLVGVESSALEAGQPVWATFPAKYDKEVIYYQGRPVPTLGDAGQRFVGVATGIKRFSGASLVAARILVEGQLRAGAPVLRWYTRPAAAPA